MATTLPLRRAFALYTSLEAASASAHAWGGFHAGVASEKEDPDQALTQMCPRQASPAARNRVCSNSPRSSIAAACGDVRATAATAGLAPSEHPSRYDRSLWRPGWPEPSGATRRFIAMAYGVWQDGSVPDVLSLSGVVGGWTTRDGMSSVSCRESRSATGRPTRGDV